MLRIIKLLKQNSSLRSVRGEDVGSINLKGKIKGYDRRFADNPFAETYRVMLSKAALRFYAEAGQYTRPLDKSTTPLDQARYHLHRFQSSPGHVNRKETLFTLHSLFDRAHRPDLCDFSTDLVFAAHKVWVEGQARTFRDNINRGLDLQIENMMDAIYESGVPELEKYASDKLLDYELRKTNKLPQNFTTDDN